MKSGPLEGPPSLSPTQNIFSISPNKKLLLLMALDEHRDSKVSYPRT